MKNIALTVVLSMTTSLVYAQGLPPAPSANNSTQSSGGSFFGIPEITQQVQNPNVPKYVQPGSPELAVPGYDPNNPGGAPNLDAYGDAANPPGDPGTGFSVSPEFAPGTFQGDPNAGTALAAPDMSAGPLGNGVDPYAGQMANTRPDPNANFGNNGFGALGLPNQQGSGSKGKESPIPGGPTDIEIAEPTLPRSDQSMNLDAFDEQYSKLVGQIDERLEQLSTENIGGKSSVDYQQVLPNASVETYASEIDEMAKVQREIRMLELRLRQATLAKQVWEEIFPPDTDAYDERIQELEDFIVEEDKKKEEEILEKEREISEALMAQAESEARIRELEEQVAELMDATETEKAELESRIQEAEAAAEEARIEAERASEAQIPNGFPFQVDENGQPISLVPDRSEIDDQIDSDPDLNDKTTLRPGISRITGISGRYVARLIYADGQQVRVSVGQVLPTGERVSSISSNGVKIEDINGNQFPLRYGQPQVPQAPMTTQNNTSVGGGTTDGLSGNSFVPMAPPSGFPPNSDLSSSGGPTMLPPSQSFVQTMIPPIQ